MKRTMVLTALCAGAWAGTVSAGEPQLGLTLGTAEGTTVGAAVRVSDRLTSRTALRLPSWGGMSVEYDATFDVRHGADFVPYVGAGIEMVGDDGDGPTRGASRVLFGVRHNATPRVRLFGETVWHRWFDVPRAPGEAAVELRLGAGVSVMF
jgi:hypothetical protein